MSLYGAFDKTLHFSELSLNLQTAEGNLTPAVRRARSGANLGVMSTDGMPLFKQVAPATMTGTATITAAQLLTRFINATPAGAVAYTMPLGADLETAWLALYPNLSADDAFEFTVQNLSVTDGQDITMTTNTGWTLSGRMLVGSNNATTLEATAVRFVVRRTAAGLFTLYRMAG